MADRLEWCAVGVEGDDGPILEGFSARVPAEGLTALVGPSGSGKSTLLRLVNRLDDPDAGEVRLDGQPVRAYDVLDLRRRVQLVGQRPVTFAGTVADNLDGRHRPRHAADVEESTRVDELLARVGLSPALANRDADRLSVGEAQRLCLSRALARRPECLLLDEPTSALDAASRAGIETLIRSLADDGLTVVMVTHDARQAGQLADRVIEVGGGR